jgi:hypothetical protein
MEPIPSAQPGLIKGDQVCSHHFGLLALASYPAPRTDLTEV